MLRRIYILILACLKISLECGDKYFLGEVKYDIHDCENAGYACTPEYETRPECVSCISPCITCTDKNVCQSCEDKFFHNPVDDSCGKDCPGKYFKNSDGNKCTKCTQGCEKCLDQKKNSCFTCFPPMTLTFQGECVLECKDGEFKHMKVLTGEKEGFRFYCQKCHKDCVTCTSGDKYSCHKCIDTKPYKAKDKSCTDNCPPRTYLADVTTGNCLPCHQDCESCTGPGQRNCEICKGGKAFNLEHICVENCPHETFRANASHCQSCVIGCKECDGPERADCFKCIDGLYFHFDDLFEFKENGVFKIMEKKIKGIGRRKYSHRICNRKCLDGFYLSEDTKTCRRCHGTCKTCDGKFETNCLNCDIKMKFISKNSTCQGIEGYYFDPGEAMKGRGGTPKECFRTCATCNPSNINECFSCKKGYFFKEGKCLQDCGDYFVGEIKKASQLTGEERCLECHSSCKRCLKPGDKTQCTSCKEIYSKIVGTRFGECMDCFQDYEKKEFSTLCDVSRVIKVKKEKESLDGFSSSSFSIHFQGQLEFTNMLREINKNLTSFFEVYFRLK